MYAAGPKNPLHGITLEMMLRQLVDHYGWEMLGQMIKINCFNFHPSIKSSLTFLRRTEWARKKVEELYLDSLPDMQPKPEAEAEPEKPAENEASGDTQSPNQ
ncbi:VF530 family DNA-binding protein [Brevifollis gellanilyticus]|nr:VF530 family protein [Brevifollis gellanilyticus]